MTTSLLAPTSLHADASLPIFDAHVHYSEDAWSHYDVAAILTLLTKANVTRALVSSTPDDGTLRLFKADAERIVPILRPYRSRADMTSWYRDPAVLTYVEQRLARGHYRGIGEFHPFDAHDAETSQVRRLTELAVQHGILLHIHSDAAPIRVLYAINPELQILWAHAGMDTSPALIGEMLDRYPTLSTELSLRASDIAPSGRLAPVWRELLLRHPDRFMVGTDTWVPWRWREYAELVQEHRQWLTQLPHEAARQIGYENAVKRFAGTFHRRPPQ
ncbi:MAG: hypothetical protein R3268_13970 [Acidiferrobacterales bacterium]|nr:hypothetical protein [Acidiferrobacterales bacterium]